ncbi:MAG: translation initiation factor IF-2 [Candidatus Oleimicrobiaceae bacterium]
MSSKRRVYLVAKEFNISNEALIEFLQHLKFDVRNQMSVVSDEAYAEVVKKYGQTAHASDADREFRKMLRDKRLQEEQKWAAARLELQERIKAVSELAQRKPRLRKLVEKPAPPAPPAEVAPVEAREERPAPVGQEAVAQTKEAAPPKPAHRRVRIVELPLTPEPPKRPAEVPEEREAKAAEAEVAPAPVEEGRIATPTAAVEEVKPKKKRKRKRQKRVVEQDAEAAVVPPAEEAKKEKLRKRHKRHKPQFTEEEIEKSIRDTLARMVDVGRKRPRRRVQGEGELEVLPERKVIRVAEYASAAELADLLGVSPAEVIGKCLRLGIMASMNQRLDMDTITLVASEFGYEVEQIEEFAADLFEVSDEEEEEKELIPRPPVVTIMGHVDHGKTSLLDRIRQSNIVAGEVGGITQHIGAYEVMVDGKAITFLDTPGHEAFTAMRARGAEVTDIVVLVVAADDAVMPQTIEAINHAKAAGVPIVVAINKIDKPGANPDLIKQQLADHGVLVESWGGKYQCAEISAKTGLGIDSLLEMILIEAELLELRANPKRLARGVIIESRLDKGKGPVATVLVQDGTLRVGDPFVAGQVAGRVRTMFDERGRKITEAGPSCPAQVLGFAEVPQAGDKFVVVSSERESREISQRRQQLHREREARRMRHKTLDQISKEIRDGKVRQLRVIVKADVDGSVEALTDALMKLSTEEVAVDIVHRGVGAISESDVLLASASDAIIIGFNIRPTIEARELAAREDIDIRLYNIIYDAVDNIKAALEGMLEPVISEKLSGTAEVRQIFRVPKVGVVAGCYVQRGKISRTDRAKVYRADKLIYEGKLLSLKRFKDDVREVPAGFECGIAIESFADLHEGDIIETYEIVKTERKL